MAHWKELMQERRAELSREAGRLSSRPEFGKLTSTGIETERQFANVMAEKMEIERILKITTQDVSADKECGFCGLLTSRADGYCSDGCRAALEDSAYGQYAYDMGDDIDDGLEDWEK